MSQKISELTPANPLAGDEQIPVVQGGETRITSPNENFVFTLLSAANTYNAPLDIPGTLGISCGDVNIQINGGDSNFVVGGDFYITTPGSFILVATNITLNGVQIIAAQQPAVADPSGGAIVDTVCRAQLSAALTALRTHGLIAT